MTEQTGPRNAASRARGHENAASIKKTGRLLRRRVKRLRSYYTLANGGDSRRPVDEWLCDNYYVLEKETKQSLKDIQRLSRGSSAELARLYGVLEAAVTKRMPKICGENLRLILTEAQKSFEISEKQFSFVPSALKLIFVSMAYKACMETGSESEMAYAVTGISRLSSIDFEGITQECSGVERTLSQDPAGVYENMSGESKRYYRRLISLIASKTGRSETQVAKEKLEAAKASGKAENHIGYAIVDDRAVTAPRRRRGAAALWLSVLLPPALCLLTGLFTKSVWVAVLCFLPFWEIARIPLWQFALAGVDVDFIPRMSLKKIKDKPKTVVLVSTLLPKAADAPALEKRLQQLYFSNSDPDMYYCILADFKEWDFPTDEKDESQILAAKKVVDGLNARYNDRFMLFLRARTFNKSQKKYCGWERKRGAITEFIRFLKGDKTSVHTFAGDASVCPSIRYIIALDSDTNMLYESAQTLVSAAIHPLNRPVIGENGLITRGYGILTPKMSTDLRSAKATGFSRILSGCGGVTAYDTRDKDFYQDLFGESIFAGKGLIDIDCFYALLNDRFPENRVLSHDILEGAYLRAGFVSDVEMTDTAPANMTSWLSRLHRWIRGDWQNLPFISRRYGDGKRVYENPVNALCKYKLFDNLRRSLTPAASFVCLVAALFVPGRAALILAIAGVLAVTLSSVWSAVWSLLTGGLFTLSRKFFTRTLPHTLELLGQAVVFMIMLPAQAFSSLDAVARSLWRLFLSRRNMLEWTTAAQSDIRKITVSSVAKRYAIPEIFGIFYMLFASDSWLVLFGVVFSLVMPVAYYSARPTEEDEHGLSSSDRDALISYNAAMWRYYEDFANAENNYLPPDNIQQSPVFRVAARTSPTNIGMMLLSVLAARDFDFIDTDGLYTRLDRTISSIEKLKLWHGNLINWYDTQTLETLKPEFVSAVDSGNFVCCLVALKEGLGEFVPEMPEFNGLIRRVESLIEKADLTGFYDHKRKLFSIGWDGETERLVDSHYDFLMSEARLTSYFAVARKTVGKKHWGALNRTMSRCGSYAGAVSWTGTMFEYYMPHLLLPVYDGSLLGEALTYCLYCQKKRAKSVDVPWGASESAFYAFDNNLNYQYKAHGVQKLGVKRYLDKDLVISPYSTFITIAQNPNSSMQNLRRLRSLGVYGRYGFFEAVDFTAERVGAGSLSVIRSYMAHHIGMSMVASCNALFENRMQERFMKDNYMNSAREFLQEKIAKNTVVYDELKHSEARGEKHERPKFREASADIYPQSPRCSLLTNGEITDILTDCGASYLKFGGVDLTRRGVDLLRRPQGVFVLARLGGEFLCATKSPFYDDGEYRFEQDERSVTYFAKKKSLELGLRCIIHPTISCEQRQIAVKNNSAKKKTAQLLIYFEPVLSVYADYNAHPAYSKLFVTAKYDSESKTLIYTRRSRDSSEDMFLTAGFLEDIDFSFETVRENLMSAPCGLDDLRDFHKKSFSNNGGGVPDACCALRLEFHLAPGSQREATLLLAASRSEAEGVAAIISMRKAGAVEPRNAAVSPLPGDSLEGRLGSGMLGSLLFTQASCEENAQEKRDNSLSQNALWSTGVSGDYPIALMEPEGDFDELAPQCYMRLHSSLRGLKVEFDLLILCDGDDAFERLTALAHKTGAGNMLGMNPGIHLLKKSSLSPEILTLIRATAAFSATKNPAVPTSYAFVPARFKPVSPAPLPDGLTVNGGVFADGRFFADRKSPLPYCHALASPVFGTLVSDSALGYTWAVNSRENKLTPWYNDICTDNTGELLILKLLTSGGYYDLVKGSRASFSPDRAVYDGLIDKLYSKATVSVSQKGFCKYIDVTLKNRSATPIEAQLAYYIEPVLHVNRDTARHIHVTRENNALLAQNPYNPAIRGFAAVSFRGDVQDPVFMNDRAAFLCGRWDEDELTPRNDPCAAIILPIKLRQNDELNLCFTLSYGAKASAAMYVPLREEPPRHFAPPPQAGEFVPNPPAWGPPSADGGAVPAGLQSQRGYPVGNSYAINTPDEHLNAIINTFIPHQILSSRILGRCAFYQCGGAYGFRDQLQDVSAYLLIDPKIARRHIIRCCTVQFEEGDVLHWWHNIPKSGGGKKGVRTRFSDDLLWLPLVAAEYVEKTGDASVLDVPAHYLKAEPLAPSEQEKYISPQRSDLSEDVFSHCVRALERGYNLGENGLILIGCGDWNDGFSRVGAGGKGTSVWLTMFLSMVLERFSVVCVLRGEASLAQKYIKRSQSLKKAVDNVCWDGQWYVRAFYDSGEPMGAHNSTECRIDLLPQSFAVLSDMPDKARVETALKSAYSELVDEDLRLVKLFDKPFAMCRENPGYVKAYPEGLRENGGQYTHAAIWFAIALMESGKTNEGFHILDMLNPAKRASFPELAKKYKLEPYYIAADVYTNQNAAGRGGWSIYTGASSWYYRAVIEHLFGLRLKGGFVEINPKLPKEWPYASLSAEISGTRIELAITRAKDADIASNSEKSRKIPLDGGTHHATIVLN